MQPVPRVQPFSRVHKTPHVPNVQPRAPTMTSQAHTQVIKLVKPQIRPCQRHTTPPIASTPLSFNAQSNVTNPSVGPPSRNTRFQSANSAKQLQRLTKLMSALEDEFHQAMAVVDNNSGKLLNYRQLLRHASYKISGAYHRQMNLDIWKME